MNTLEPNVKAMLEIGKDCGLLTVEQALSNYMRHYDMFFLIEKFHEQQDKFLKDMSAYGLGVIEANTFTPVDMSIEEALTKTDWTNP